MSGLPHHTSDPECLLCSNKLESAHEVLRDWFNTHVKTKYPSAHVSWAYRNQVDQEDCFKRGVTKLHYPQSKHNKIPALAIDLFELDEAGHAKWDPRFFLSLNADNEDSRFPIHWGGRFKHLGDADHFELLDASVSDAKGTLEHVKGPEKPNLA